MPKEQGHFGERAARGASKTAKDKSNSATLRASQGGTHREQSGMGDVSNRMLRCDSEKDSEKDSGYSEAGSDSVHTDVDDQRSSVSEPHRERSKNPNSSGNNGVNAAARNMPPYEELTPIYVIKNLVVKPSRPDQLLHGPLAWGGGWHSLTNAKAPTQLLLIQQPAMSAPTSTTPGPSSGLVVPQGQVKKGGSRSSQNHGKNHSSKNSYLPILNSYPRIAPHPRKESHEGKGATWKEGVKESGSEGQSKSKRVCIEEEKREAVSTTSHLLKPQQQHQKEARVHTQSQYKGRGGHSSFPSSTHASSTTTQHKSHHCQQSSGSDSVGSPSVSSSQTPSPPSSSDSPSSSSSSSSSPPSSSPFSSMAHSPHCLAPDSSSTRHRRFLNTAEILNQSGLLAITLRTKELLKQNAATDREIAQLRQHTQLLCQVAQASQSRCSEGSDSLKKLLQTMSESGSYPNLDFNQLKVLSGSQQSKSRSEEDKEKDTRTTETHSHPVQVVSLHNIDDGTSPPSPLFAPSPDTEDREQADGPLDHMSTSLSVSLSRSVPEQGGRQADTDKNLSDLTMLPESSTHNNYLL